SSSIGSEVIALPSAATIAARITAAAPAPDSADGQLRVVPTASTIVRASTASTAQARNTETANPSSAPVMCHMNLAAAGEDAVESGHGGAPHSLEGPDGGGHGAHRRDRAGGRRRAGPCSRGCERARHGATALRRRAEGVE